MDHVSLSIALGLLFAGLGYGLPFRLFPESHFWNGPTAPEILNLYCLVTWMGLAHFVYAYHGHARYLMKQPQRVLPYAAMTLAGAVILYGLLHFLGKTFFNSLVWIYFIPHFLKSESLFSNTLSKSGIRHNWEIYWFPAFAFAYFSAALYGAQYIPYSGWFLFIGAIVCTIAAYKGGIFQHLKNKNLSPYAILGFLFIGEGLLWGNYSQQMTQQFQDGVYIFHISLASFYHYFHAYVFAEKMKFRGRSAERNRYISGFFVINVLMIILGYFVLHMPSTNVLYTVFDVKFFTFWVGMHLIACDGFNWIKVKK